MVERCAGANYALQLGDGIVEIRTMPFGRPVATLAVNKIGSVELLRRSVMPPAAVGTAALISSLVLRLAGDELLASIAGEFRGFSEIAALGLAATCLILIVERWFFAKLVVTPSDMAPITLSMVPAKSAKRFVEGFQNQLSASVRNSSEGPA